MPPKLLIVDDEPNVRRSVAIGLRLEGFDVASAGSGEEALRMIAEGGAAYDLVLVDWMMPGITGLELARVLRERHPELRVVLTSAHDVSERQIALAGCGALGFVPKPYDLAALALLLRSKLEPSSAPA